jgi:hypothetical protein
VAFGVLYAVLIQINLPLTLGLHLLQILSAGVIFGYLRLRFKSIFLPTFAHGLLNTMGAASSLLFQERRPFLADFGGIIGVAVVVALAAALLAWPARSPVLAS